MAFFSQLGLLLWKNWILQRRRLCVSIFEILFPLFFMAILLVLRNAIGVTSHPDTRTWGKRSIEPFSNDRTVVGYTPAGQEVKSFMGHVHDMYINDSKSYRSKMVFKDFVDESAMDTYVRNNPGRMAMGISFLNVQDDGTKELPRDIRFDIRPPTRRSPWRTRNTYDDSAPLTAPRDEKRNNYDEVIYFQTLVGRSLINYWLTKTGGDPNDVELKLYTERMAFPPYTKDSMSFLVQGLLPLFLILSLIISVIINTKNLVQEKERKLKESMKMMGLLPSSHLTSWFVTFSFYLIPVLVLFAVFLGVPIVGKNGAILQKSDASVIFVFLLVYGLAIITFCFMIASMVQRANVAAALSGILYFVTYFLQFYILPNYGDLTKGAKLAFALFFNCGMILGVNILGLHEGTGEGAQWSNFSKPATLDDDISLLDCVLMLLVDCVLHLLVYWYLDNVRPGEFGVPQPLYFCFTKSYWCGSREEISGLSRQRSDAGERSKRFEREPTNLKAGIQIRELTKAFGKKAAVDEVSLNMYEGQITVLLGHNGAGKTTTMSMLTGFLPPSSGSAIVNGYDITKDLRGVRSSLGLCPQHNILFDTLTVTQHLQFFAGLKGASNKQAEQEIGPLLAEVGLLEKKDEQTVKLSGGQKRKLSVAIALIAGSKILILDEPSSGMDPGARRQTWDVLQRHRNGRTILLTTHYMDEADVLGDRIAIMAEGVVKCCGTSMFLKKLYGAGYHLVIVKNPSCVVNKITEVVKSHIDTAKLETVINNEVTYLLPEKETAKFTDLFREMDDRKEELGISSFGTSATTMEEVFLKVGETAHHHDDRTDDEAGSIQVHDNKAFDPKALPTAVELEDTTVRFSPTGENPYVRMVDANNADVMKFTKGYQKNKGLALEMEKIRGIFVKKALHTWRNRTITLTQLMLPVAFTCLGLAIGYIAAGSSSDDPPLTLNLAKFDPTFIPTTSGNPVTRDNMRLEKLYGQQFDSRQTVESFQLAKYGKYDNYTLKQADEMGIASFNQRVIVGLEMSNDSVYPNAVVAISHYNGQPLHAEPVGVNYMMNALLQFYLNESYSLQSTLFPFPMESTDKDNGYEDIGGFPIALFIGFGMAFLTTLYIYDNIKERQVGAKHLQVVSGVSPLTFWLPTYLWDLVFYLGTCLCILIVFVGFDNTAFVGGTRLGVLFFHLMMYGWAVLPFMYALQFIFKNPATGVVIVTILNILSGLFCLLLVFFMRSAPATRDTADLLDYVFLVIFPNYSMSQGIVDIYNNYRTNLQCEGVPCNVGGSNPCCKDTCGDSCYKFETNYLSLNKPGIGLNSLIFFASGIFYFLLVFLVEFHILQRIWYAIVRMVCSNSETEYSQRNQDVFQDSDVVQEREKINTNTPEDLSRTDSLLLVNLFKKYGKKVAVDHMCLAVPKEECFGLLGQNGAGKTTTFKMLTGDVMVSGGNAYLSGYDIRNNIKKVQSNMGYCPQFDALLDQMTGRETLTLYGRLRGVPEKHLPEVVNSLIDVLTLTPHADKLAGAYSGGNKRKLSTAISLVGMPHFIMLDEPSAGMDPKARRQLWNVLSGVRALGHTLVLTSHSMEECDALCTRLAIMVNGQFMCLGSPQHLKNKFGEGYTLVVQIGQKDDGTREPIEPLVNFISRSLPGLKVFDDHQGYVHFQVPDSQIKLHVVFSVMESVKKRFDIQHYSVTQTTLEQIFLTFTRTQDVVDQQ